MTNTILSDHARDYAKDRDLFSFGVGMVLTEEVAQAIHAIGYASGGRNERTSMGDDSSER